MNRTLLFIAALVSIRFSVFSQVKVNLADTQPSWTTVLGGSVLTTPVRNSTGYIAAIEGKMLYAFNEEGTIIWKHSVSSKPDIMSVGKGGMLYLITRSNRLSIVNPSGFELWKVNTGFNVIEKPLPGRDGRVFVRGNVELSCYGIKGARRWHMNIAEQNTSIPLIELNDGRLLVFLNKSRSGQSIAYIISPFGQLEEEIVFSGIVASAESCSQGVLLSFSDGSIGLCTVKNGKTVSQWILGKSETGFSSSAIIVPAAFPDSIAAFASGSKLLYINQKNGAITASLSSSVNASSGNTSSLAFKGVTAQGLVLADKAGAECYDRRGVLIWQARFNTSKAWDYLIVTDDGYIVFCINDWVIESYRVWQSTAASASSYTEQAFSHYRDLYSKTSISSNEILGRAVSSKLSKEIAEGWKSEDFGTKEKQWLSILSNEMDSLYYDWMTASPTQNPYFKQNVSYTQEILNLASESGICLYQNYIA
ncbi:MAG: hypothetical protein IJ828_08025, partial [Treponema sp.]|nr:hypothetical protein [Treponema sp.]